MIQLLLLLLGWVSLIIIICALLSYQLHHGFTQKNPSTNKYTIAAEQYYTQTKEKPVK